MPTRSEVHAPPWSPPVLTAALLVVLSLLVVGQMYGALAITGEIAADLEVAGPDVTFSPTAGPWCSRR